MIVSSQIRSTQASPSIRIVLLLFASALSFSVLAGCFFSFDDSLSELLTDVHIPGDIRKAIELSEAFAHGFGAATILGTTLIICREKRGVIWVAALLTVCSGLAANGLKSCIVRIRPHSAQLIAVAGHEDAGPTTASDDSAIEVVEEDFWDSRQRSFPSGHSATAWGLMIGLSLAFPRGCVVFGVLAAVASFQRIWSGAHYPSDVAAGAAIACLISAAILSVPKLRRIALKS